MLSFCECIKTIHSHIYCSVSCTLRIVTTNVKSRRITSGVLKLDKSLTLISVILSSPLTLRKWKTSSVACHISPVIWIQNPKSLGAIDKVIEGAWLQPSKLEINDMRIRRRATGETFAPPRKLQAMSIISMFFPRRVKSNRQSTRSLRGWEKRENQCDMVAFWMSIHSQPLATQSSFWPQFMKRGFDLLLQ